MTLGTCRCGRRPRFFPDAFDELWHGRGRDWGVHPAHPTVWCKACRETICECNQCDEWLGPRNICLLSSLQIIGRWNATHRL